MQERKCEDSPQIDRQIHCRSRQISLSVNRQANYEIPVKFKCFRRAKSTLTGREEQIWGTQFSDLDLS